MTFHIIKTLHIIFFTGLWIWLDKTKRIPGFRSSHLDVFCKKGVLKKLKTHSKLLCLKIFLNKVADLRPATLLKKRLREEAKVFFCEFCKISKNTYSYRTPQVAASLVCCHLFYKKDRTAIPVNLFLNSILSSHYYLALKH